MDESSSLSDEFGVLRKQLGKITDERLSRGQVFPLDGVLGLMVLGADVRSALLERHKQVR